MNTDNLAPENDNSEGTLNVDDFFADKPSYNPEIPEEMTLGMLYYAEKFALLAGDLLFEKIPPSAADSGESAEALSARIADRFKSFLIYSMIEKLGLLAERGDKWAEQVSVCIEKEYRKFWQDKSDQEIRECNKLAESGQIFLSSAEKEKLCDPFFFLKGTSYRDEDMQNNPVTRLCTQVMGDYYLEEEHPEAGTFLMEMAGFVLNDYFACFWEE